MQADGQPALRPSKQRPPTGRGLFSLPSLMLTLPHNTLGQKHCPHTEGCKAQMGTAPPLHLSALRELSTVLWRLILFILPDFESHKHTYLLPPTVHASFKLLKDGC